jgi:hypothetical protein
MLNELSKDNDLGGISYRGRRSRFASKNVLQDDEFQLHLAPRSQFSWQVRSIYLILMGEHCSMYVWIDALDYMGGVLVRCTLYKFRHSSLVSSFKRHSLGWDVDFGIALFCTEEPYYNMAIKVRLGIRCKENCMDCSLTVRFGEQIISDSLSWTINQAKQIMEL